MSVDSDSIGTKKSFSGQASSQSTRPSFGRAVRRTNRYSPRSRRSTSNSWPASIRSCSRSSAGSTIWPFEETLVFTGVRYRLTQSGSRAPPLFGPRATFDLTSTLRPSTFVLSSAFGIAPETAKPADSVGPSWESFVRVSAPCRPRVRRLRAARRVRRGSPVRRLARRCSDVVGSR